MKKNFLYTALFALMLASCLILFGFLFIIRSIV